jgi:hypothetical protein
MESPSSLLLQGKVVVITGSTAGIGKAASITGVALPVDGGFLAV